MTKSRLVLFSLFAVLMGFNAVPAFATPHCRACPYSCYDLGLGHKDCSELPHGGNNVCCVDLTRKGIELAEAQDHVAPAQENCPAGFSPSERKCSNDERRHGCKDIRLDSGLGCVKR